MHVGIKVVCMDIVTVNDKLREQDGALNGTLHEEKP